MQVRIETYERCTTTTHQGATGGATFVEGPSTLFMKMFCSPDGKIRSIGVVGDRKIMVETDEDWNYIIYPRTGCIGRTKNGGEVAEEYLSRAGWQKWPKDTPDTHPPNAVSIFG
ncbi:hypothetical protein C4544_06425 [candidate division WS5 bacterium]|uniref:Uncharacterized protein n=1 Tax=candidate division WS5 bacterium TaxID=2093353 RepID=A0A419DA41_9BACT|nr:MAG: hypothetical protein C4544_06425 [candidate division WS5 bacterium]